jgi:TusA-related sulfurtransferase
LVIFHLQEHLEPGELFKIVGDKSIASDLFSCYAREQDCELLKMFYHQEDRHVDTANLTIQEAFQLEVRLNPYIIMYTYTCHRMYRIKWLNYMLHSNIETILIHSMSR